MKKFLIVGLGNIGLEYDNTRHNVGFKILDRIAQENKALWEVKKLASYSTFKKKGKDFRKFGKYSNCKKRFKISAELEDAILNSDFDKIEIIVKKNIEN